MISSLRFHWVIPDRATAAQYSNNMSEGTIKHLWAYTNSLAAAMSVCSRSPPIFAGTRCSISSRPIQVFDTPSLELAKQHYPNVECAAT